MKNFNDIFPFHLLTERDKDITILQMATSTKANGKKATKMELERCMEMMDQFIMENTKRIRSRFYKHFVLTHFSILAFMSVCNI